MLDELELGDNIARNKALSENVFMMVVCIELRIPLFVVGKPGSSKSLAKTVVTDKMLLKFIVRLMDNHVISLSDELPTKEMVRKSFV